MTQEYGRSGSLTTKPFTPAAPFSAIELALSDLWMD
jgi:hypothetical protein